MSGACHESSSSVEPQHDSCHGVPLKGAVPRSHTPNVTLASYQTNLQDEKFGTYESRHFFELGMLG